MKFSDELLKSINDWQKGWREDQDKREQLSKELVKQCASLPDEYKQLDIPCYRKRFLHKGELIDIIMADEKHEGVVSWTTDEKYAERFKGLLKEDAVTGAIFKIKPNSEDIIVNIVSLWRDVEFVTAVEEYAKKDPENTKALLHFKDTQSEIILKSPLRGSDIIALTGIASPFDDLCDQAGIAEEQRDDIFRQLVESGDYVDEPRYTPPGGAQAVLKRTIMNFHQRIIDLSQANT
ncbi:hypothetical protein P7M43_20800 [Vibrio parahaemolyticus]|nr:hypothetical protein [Vibrio parahaemolyticus]